MAIESTKLYMKFPSTIIMIYDIFIKEKINEHGICKVDLLVKEKERFEVVSKLNINTNIKIIYLDNGSEKILFCGLPTNVVVKHVRGNFRVSITLETTSFRMDITKKFRSFQNIDNLFSDMFQQIICKDNKGDFLDMGSKGSVQKYSFIQYNETDWEFIKRMASRLKQVLIVEVAKEKPSIYLGCPKKPCYRHKKSNHEITKDLRRHNIYNKNFDEWREEENVSIRFDSTLDYDLCDNIIFNDINLRVVEKETNLNEGILIFTYILKTNLSIKQNLKFNKNVKGVSINGKVISLKNDTMKLHLEIDESQNIDTAYWYKYNTPYTTESNTGFYCMPQVGDNVKLYIPNYFEENAFINTVNRLDGESNSKTKDPSIKYFGTIYGKEMKLAPKQLKFTVKENKLFIDMTDDGGINIHSDNDINVYSEKDINLNSEKISLKAKDEILIRTKESNIIVNKTVDLKSDGGVSL